jgi:5-methylthioadenosine/S-adenosylhomocysteine deaminase
MPIRRIEGATVLTIVPGEEPIEDGVVEWEGDALTYVGGREGAPTREADEMFGGRGCVVMPGLVNAHTHLAMTLFRGFADDMPLQSWLEEKIWPTEAKLVAEDVYWGTRLGVLELLRGGVTCFADMYHYYEAASQAAWDGGIRACPSGVLLGFLNNAGDLLKRAVDFTQEARARHGARIHPMLGPHAQYTCPDDLLREVAEAAREHGMAMHIHVSETEHEVAESVAQNGLRPVQHLERLGFLEGQVLAAHCVWLDEADIRTLAEREVGVAHCPGSNLKLASGFAPVPELLAAGAVVGLGTDGAASNNNLDMIEEARLAALIHKGRTGDPTVVNAHEALEMATRGGARALGLGGLVGTLEVGKRADLALLDLSSPHLQPVHNVVSQVVYAARAEDVRMTVVNGEVVMWNGGFRGQDVGEIVRQCGRRARRLAG